MTKAEYLKKVALANEWMSAYYNDEPRASDDEYDALIRELRVFEAAFKDDVSANSPTQKVAPSIQSEFKKLSHIEQMWSMEDIFNEEELFAWSKRVKCEEGFFVEPKFDGASLNLRYEYGLLKSGATRGDGLVGEDVTLNVLEIDSIPKSIPYKKSIEIRGEVLIFKDDFEKINASRAKEAKSLFANPRNAASGSLRQLDTLITRQRRLRFYPWGLGEHSLEFKKHSELMDFVRELGFLKDDFVGVCKDLDEVLSFYKKLLALRDEKPMMMDGMVVRINDLSLCKSLGYTVKAPKFMVAFKFPALEKTTRLLDVNLQVGRSGVITPVAVLEPVNLDGVTVKSATLHNFDEISRLDLCINDFVNIIRSGDVIPKITKVYKQRRSGIEKEISKPKFCPICSSLLLNEKALTKCQNLNCEARLLNSIIYFVSKKCMDIDGLGENIVELLYQEKKISNALSIYALRYDDFLNLEGFKDKKIKNILNSIENSKERELFKFINALGIEHIGEVAAKKIATSFSFEWIDKAYDDFYALEGFGAEMASSLVDFLKLNYELILDFYKILRLKNSSKNVSTNSIFKDKTVVITGTISKPRDEFKSLLENLGAKISSSISKKTHFLLCGDEAGSKLQKARDLGIRIITEEEFNSLIKE